MKTQEEIKKLATKHYKSNGSGGGQYTEGLQEGRVMGYVDGYTQCQEDMSDKKYTEEDIRKAINVGISAEAGDYPDGWSFKLGISLEDYFINLLNKQD